MTLVSYCCLFGFERRGDPVFSGLFVSSTALFSPSQKLFIHRIQSLNTYMKY
jgi:hypothetical protein